MEIPSVQSSVVEDALKNNFIFTPSQPRRSYLSGRSTECGCSQSIQLHTHACINSIVYSQIIQLHTHACINSIVYSQIIQLHTHACINFIVYSQIIQLHTHACFNSIVYSQIIQLHTHACINSVVYVTLHGYSQVLHVRRQRYTAFRFAVEFSEM